MNDAIREDGRVGERAPESDSNPLFRDVLAIVLLTLVVFSFGFTNELLWDDEHLLRAARSLASPLRAFEWGSLGLGDGQRISFWRPLTTLSYYFESRLFGDSPLVFRTTNLVLHLASTILAHRFAFRRLGGKSETSRFLAFAVALLWAVVPLKAEAVSWISGRADLLGAFFVLLGFEVSARAKTLRGEAFTIAAFSLLAVLSKEAYVTAALFLFLASRRSFDDLVRSPSTYVALVPNVAYVVLRLAGPGLGGGGGKLLAALPLFDRVELVVETFGTSVATLGFPFASVFFRGAIGFDEFGLVWMPFFGALGLVSLLVVTVLALRVEAVRRPFGEIFVLLLPVANVIPTGIEARLCDRYVYLTLLPFLLVLARATLDLGGRRARTIAFGFVILGVAAAPLGALRAYEFARPELLFERELRGSPPHSMFDEAAFVFTETGKLEAARDAFIGAVKRRESLGLPFLLRDALLAARLEQDISGDQWPEGRAAFAKLTKCLLERSAEATSFPLRDPFFSFRIPCNDPILERAALENREVLRAMQLVVLARAGLPVRSTIEEAFRSCPECTLASADLAQAALALDEPELALEILGTEKRKLFDRLREIARVQIALRDEASSRAARLFVGAAYRPACFALRSETSDTVNSPLEQAACALGGEEKSARFALGSSETRHLRISPAARIAFVKTKSTQPH